MCGARGTHVVLMLFKMLPEVPVVVMLANMLTREIAFQCATIKACILSRRQQSRNTVQQDTPRLASATERFRMDDRNDSTPGI